MRRETVELLVCPLSGGPLELEVHEVDADRDEIVAGVLRSDAAAYPVVAGIPVMLADQDEALRLVRQGRHEAAAAFVAFGQLPQSRVIPILDGLGVATRVLRPATARLEQQLRDRQVNGWADLVRDDADPFAPLRFLYLDSRRRIVDAYHYFRYRLGTPRHLVALALFDAIRPGPGPILDVGCGCGQISAGLALLQPDRRVVAIDRSLALLLTARRLLGGRVELVCGDGAALPFPAGAFGLVSSCDVLQYTDNAWASARELRRVAGDQGTILATALRNRHQAHVYGGRTLSPQGWSALLGGLLAWSDADLLDDYLAGRRPSAAGSTPERLHDAQTLSVLAGAAPPSLEGGHRPGWAHALGRLGVNPLYRLESASGDRLSYELTWPSGNYQRDNPLASRYLPDRFTVPTAAVTAGLDGSAHPDLDAAIAGAAVVGLPVGHPGDPWAPTDAPGNARPGATGAARRVTARARQPPLTAGARR